MVESEAQGRLPGMEPVSVVDIGSNSIRLVIYEGLNRAPAMLFNEKVMCGLGAGLAQTGNMEPKNVERALSALRRFKALAKQARSGTTYAIATAAARDARNGPDFVQQAEAILGQKIRLLSGEEEAHFSALGIVSGYFDADGIVGDLGGGSLELVDVKGRSHGKGLTTPLGGIRLSEQGDGSLTRAANYARKYLREVDFLKEGEGRTFYAVGGTWRALAKLHMELRNYPLHMIQDYRLSLDEVMIFLDEVIRNKDQKEPAYQAVSRARRALLPYGAVAMREVLAEMKPSRVSFSQGGVREGYLYSLLPEKERMQDPLLSAARELAVLRARSPEHARELATWTGDILPAFGVRETVEEGRYRQAACLLADISWRAHPDYRGRQALNLIAHGAFTGITHPGRAFIALTNYYRFEGLRDDHETDELATIATPRFLELSKLLGGLLRVAYIFSASMPGVVRNLRFEPPRNSASNADLELVVPHDYIAFQGERVEGRLQQLAKLTGKKLTLRFE
jgi:exopolyphosphatase/guanosine-5'-triphosphate,3'-diphosphate pyrophosphatase